MQEVRVRPRAPNHLGVRALPGPGHWRLDPPSVSPWIGCRGLGARQQLDLAAVVPALLPLNGCSQRSLGASFMLILAVSFLAPQVLLPLDGPPMPWALAACRFAAGVAVTGYGVVCGVVLSELPEERRTKALAQVEMSWFLASFVVPFFGDLLDAFGATLSIVLLIVLPAALLSLAMARFLPGRSGGDKVGAAAAADDDGSAAAAVDGSLLARMAGVLAWGALVMFSQAAFQCRYGGWLTDKFDMSATELGHFSNAIGLGNLAGNFVVQLASGRVSLRMLCACTTMGLFFLNGALVLLPSSASIWLLFGLMFLYFFFFEIGFLTSYSYTTQLLGDSKTIGMSYYFALMALGRVAGDWVAPFPSMSLLFAWSAVAYAVAAGALVSFGSLARARERGTGRVQVAVV
mmetsp:Transcript_91234/g.292978  ORF Transcript_91234/g.292978 Transcript_91234/m.292978 type:complete len:404 (-) Transcript_91234:6-1217(-)